MSQENDHGQAPKAAAWKNQTVTRTRPSARRDRLARLLSRPLLLEESGPPRVLLHLLVIGGLLVLLAIGWAGITSVTETAVAHGQIIPSGSVRMVEHLEGGIVSEILVENGEVVERGQTLIRLKNVESLSELKRLRTQEASLALRAERLRAFVLNREPDFSMGDDFPDLAADQKAILQIQIEARESQREVLLSRIEQRKAELAGYQEQRRNLETQIEITERQADMRRKLVEKGLDSQVNLLDVERRVTEISGELVGLLSESAKSQEALHEAKNSLIELEAKLRNEALSEMGIVTGELAEVRQSVIRLDDRVSRLDVTAPVDGIVKGLVTRTVGSAVAPGAPIVEIVPLGETLVAEVQILPRDVGHMKVGQPARVKIDTYDIARFGALEGEVKHLSASTFQDEDGEPYYKGIIALAQNYVGEVPGRHLVLPGMVVDADINTGTKTLLQYLLKPVYRAFDSAFHER